MTLIPPARLLSTAILAVCLRGESPPVSVTSVELSGQLGLRAPDVQQALRATRAKTMLPGIPHLWKGWRLLPAYTPDTVQADLGNLRSFYYQHGYFDAQVRLESAEVTKNRARIAFAIDAGTRYSVREFDGISIWPPRHTGMPLEAVCRDLLLERRNAERQGVLEFTSNLTVGDLAQGAGWVDVSSNNRLGPAYRTDRIEFRGNHSFRDSTLRRMLLFNEAAPLDPILVRRSLSRLNRTQWFEPLRHEDVVVRTNLDSGRADVFIRLKEKKPRQWYLSGPAGPMSIGGSFHFTLGSRLPPWGQGILELSTYTLSANLFLFAKPIGALVPFLPNRRFLSVFTVQRPVLPGQPLLSGFGITPQLGWIGVVGGYATAQSRGLLERLVDTNKRFTPPLTVTLTHGPSSGSFSCQPSTTRLDRVRAIGAMAGNVVLSFAPF